MLVYRTLTQEDLIMLVYRTLTQEDLIILVYKDLQEVEKLFSGKKNVYVYDPSFTVPHTFLHISSVIRSLPTAKRAFSYTLVPESIHIFCGSLFLATKYLKSSARRVRNTYIIVSVEAFMMALSNPKIYSLIDHRSLSCFLDSI